MVAVAVSVKIVAGIIDGMRLVVVAVAGGGEDDEDAAAGGAAAGGHVVTDPLVVNDFL